MASIIITICSTEYACTRYSYVAVTFFFSSFFSSKWLLIPGTFYEQYRTQSLCRTTRYTRTEHEKVGIAAVDCGQIGVRCLSSTSGVVNTAGWTCGTTAVLQTEDGYTQLNPFRTAVPFWGQSSKISSSFVPKRDSGSKGVKRYCCCRCCVDPQPEQPQ